MSRHHVDTRNATTDRTSDVEQRDLPCVVATTAEEFVGRLATVSAYLKLSSQQRAEALRQVRSALPDQVDIDATVQLSLARRVDESVSWAMRLSLSNCDRKPFVHTGQAGEPTPRSTATAKGRGGLESRRCRGELNGWARAG